MGSLDMLSEDDECLKRASAYCLRDVAPTSDILHLSIEKQHFIRVYTCQPIVQIGGFQYFFEADWPGNPPYDRFTKAYDAIGSTEASNLLSRAVALFPFAEPHLQLNSRVRFLRDHCVEADSEMAFLSGLMMDESDGVFAMLARYVRENSKCFGGI